MQPPTQKIASNHQPETMIIKTPVKVMLSQTSPRARLHANNLVAMCLSASAHIVIAGHVLEHD
jgi:hypothetical protein